MIVTKGVDIICSHGDTFECAWEVEGVTVAGSTIFSVKPTAGSTDVLLAADCIKSGQIIRVAISADDFATLAVGDYVYDIVMISGDVKTTLLFPANFSVRAVVHNE